MKQLFSLKLSINSVLRKIKHDSFIFRCFKLDTMKIGCTVTEYKAPLTAYDFKMRTEEPTRVIPSSKVCMGCEICSNFISREKLPSTISELFTVGAASPLDQKRKKLKS